MTHTLLCVLAPHRAVTNVPDNIDPGLWTNLYGICAGAAAGGNILSSIVCMLFFMALNMGPECTSRAFIDYFLLLLPLPLLLLVVRPTPADRIA